MGVAFICPECRTTAVIIAGGHVREHNTRQGDTCKFTRTAGSGRAASGGGKPVKTPVQSMRVRATPTNAGKRASEKCPSCGQMNRIRLDGTFRAHRTSGGSWCSDGDLPTEGQATRAAERAERTSLRKKQQSRTGPKRKGKKRAKSKGSGSVWTVGSGGLPGLGKRR